MGLLERLLGWQGQRVCQSCAACSEMLPSAGALVNHLVKKHFKGSPFPCVFLTCGKMMVSVRQLNDHLRQHATEAGEKMHACASCGRSFTSAANLKRHARVHDRTLPRSCKCAACGTRFTVVAELYAHERSIHDVYRAYECQLCELAFTRIGAMQRHLDRVHASGTHASGTHAEGFERVRDLHAEEPLDHNANRRCDPVESLPLPTAPQQALRTCPGSGDPIDIGNTVPSSSVEDCNPASGARRTARPLFSKRKARERSGIVVGCKKVWRCTECDSRFVNAASLQGHLQRHLQMRRSRNDRFPLSAVL